MLSWILGPGAYRLLEIWHEDFLLLVPIDWQHHIRTAAGKKSREAVSLAISHRESELY